MNSETEVSVTLTPKLYEHLSTESRRLGLPIEWLVASLVVDTMEADGTSPASA